MDFLLLSKRETSFLQSEARISKLNDEISSLKENLSSLKASLQASEKQLTDVLLEKTSLHQTAKEKSQQVRKIGDSFKTRLINLSVILRFFSLFTFFKSGIIHITNLH